MLFLAFIFILAILRLVNSHNRIVEAMILYLMRHGQTNWNLQGRTQGWKDTPLNDCGLNQARMAAERLKSQQIETIYSSDLKRCKKTADIISATLDLPIHYTQKLREMNFGKAEGVKKTDLAAKFPYIFQAFNDIKNVGRDEIAYPDGETIGEVQQRFIKFINRLRTDGRQNVLIVTHGMLIRLFSEAVFKKTIRLDNGSVLRLVFDEKSKKFRSPKILF